MLKELSSSGFLPTHGIPIHILPFVNSCKESIDAEKNVDRESTTERDDSTNRFRSYPSRQLPIAIREYARESGCHRRYHVQIARLNLTLEVAPTDEGFRETQAIQNFCFCKGRVDIPKRLRRFPTIAKAVIALRLKDIDLSSIRVRGRFF